MPSFLPHIFGHEQFLLTRERTMFWEKEKVLIVSDLHLGKSGHFRKSGIAVPSASNTGDMQRFIAQIQYFKPTRVLIVGDLFHSSLNSEADFFLRWRRDIVDTEMLLVKGNHDIIQDHWYKQAGIIVFEEHLDWGPFRFTHGDKDIAGQYTGFIISGHTHPAVSIKGAGKQSLRLPCFYFSKNKAVLPAFGNFTGRYTVQPKKQDEVFVITAEEVIRMK